MGGRTTSQLLLDLVICIDLLEADRQWVLSKWLGQFLMGISMGARFRREIVMRLPRLLVTSAIFVLLRTILLFGYAVVLSVATGLDIASAALGASPESCYDTLRS
jgi:uncharacterized membrane protein AbrB (regulator of aidB expression)